MVVGGFRPVDRDSMRLQIVFKLLEIRVEVAQRMLFNLRGKAAHLFPFGHSGRYFVTAHTSSPKTTVVAFAVGCVGNEFGAEFHLINLFAHN